MKRDKLDPINGLKTKPRDMSKYRKINPDLVREAILAIGSSAPRKGYKAYYNYYMERERETRPDFKHSFNIFMLWCDRIIKSDKKVQSVLLAQYLRKKDILKAVNNGTRLNW
ncbi:hypothetical protein [Helicobacter suis]|uniref:hypothetical protein n=1 Tax=Helicobacter suis TaxID=104628 RepID=UPI0013D5EDC3|nr:hypothetical protein [Helicobacter suis]